MYVPNGTSKKMKSKDMSYDDLVKKFGELQSNNQASSKGSRCLILQQKEVPDSLADPIGEMQKERLRNCPPVNVVYLGDDADSEENEVVPLNSIEFPEEYAYLLDLEVLNEDTLRPIKRLWKTINDTPFKTKNIIKKEVALICLSWAQSKLDEKVAVMDYALLKYHCCMNEKRGSGKNTKVIVLELKREEQDGQIGKFIRKGSTLKFMRLCSQEMLKIPWAKVKVIRDNFIQVSVSVYGAKSKSGKELIQMLELLDNEPVAVYEAQPDFIPQSMLRSVERIKTGVLNNIINPKIEEATDNVEFRESFKRFRSTLRAYTGLNTHQSQCLYSICTSSHKEAPYVLHGPPGTGKTRVIASTVRCLLEMDPNIRILLTTPSNMAADILALKLMEQFTHVMHSGNVLRLRSIGNDFVGRDRRLDPISCLDTVGDVFKIPSAKEFQNYRVVISTLGCSTHIINRGIPPGFYTHIFLDEAGQAAESEIWIPLGGLATAETSVIFCGDPNQLGPVIGLDLPNYVTKRFDSALVRYMSMPFYEFDDRLFCQLRHSYRCHESILDIVSLLFYKQNLESGVVYRKEPFLKWDALPNKKMPILFVNVEGKQFIDPNSKSYANKHEIEVILAYIQKLFKDFNVKPADIGVISPYRYQTSLLIDALDKKVIKDRSLTVDSVERFQGSERKVILMTTTRTKGLGFVGCDLRLNTSITRAMNLLIVVGNKKALFNHISWMQFIEYCDSKGAVVDWTGEVSIFK